MGVCLLVVMTVLRACTYVGIHSLGCVMMGSSFLLGGGDGVSSACQMMVSGMGASGKESRSSASSLSKSSHCCWTS